MALTSGGGEVKLALPQKSEERTPEATTAYPGDDPRSIANGD